MKDILHKKLNPAAVKVSGVFYNILAHLIGARGWTTQEVSSLTCNVYGWVFGRLGNLPGPMALIHRSELYDLTEGLANVVGLSAEERVYLLDLIPKPGE